VTTVGDVSLDAAVMTASGTAGHGDELAGYGELSDLGAVVVKSLAAFAWAGNPPPRVAPASNAMVNSVGLAGPGVAAWRERDLPRLLARGATVVGSIWGRSTEEFAAAAEAMRGAQIAAIEVNASCPNLEGGSTMFAHSPAATAELVGAAAAAGVPRWLKLSPNTPRIVEIAGAALDAGAEAIVLTNTLSGLVVDVESGRPALGAVGGGVSGPAILPVALRAVFDCRAAYPGAAIVGVGGVSSGEDAVAMVMAGADAVQVGTATFAEPRAPWRIQRELGRWLERHDETVMSIKGRAHG
jgi:dihydroorotate dehydrogenase (NAD+) catalytic subunit